MAEGQLPNGSSQPGLALRVTTGRSAARAAGQSLTPQDRARSKAAIRVYATPFSDNSPTIPGAPMIEGLVTGTLIGHAEERQGKHDSAFVLVKVKTQSG